MTYQQSVEMFANPPGMCAVTQANNLVMSAGKVIEFVGTRAMKGNLHNQITIADRDWETSQQIADKS